MRTTTVGELRILLPELDPDDLDTISDPTDDLSDATIENVSWRGGTLDGVTVRGSRLVGVDVSESGWEGGSLFGCEITRADFSGTTLSGVSMERCAITGSRFTGIRLTDVRLKDVLFEGCRFDYASFRPGRRSRSRGFRGLPSYRRHVVVVPPTQHCPAILPTGPPGTRLLSAPWR